MQPSKTCLTLKSLFGMALRQTTGFVESLLRLVGLDWTAGLQHLQQHPCRRRPVVVQCSDRHQKTLTVNIPCRGSSGPLHLPIDSTGIKGEGEWRGQVRRVWRKIHLGIDGQTLEVRAVETTGSHIGDAPVLPDLLDRIPKGREIGWATAPQERQALEDHHHRCGRATRPCGRRNILAGRSGEGGADTTAGAASKRRCIA